MPIERKEHICHFCREAIDPKLIRQQSVARDNSSWVIIRGGVKRKHVGVKLGSRFAHNSCAEGAHGGKVIPGQEELWPSM